MTTVDNNEELSYNMDAFDFVEVDNNTNENVQDNEDEMEFAFPLFSSAPAADNKEDENDRSSLRQQIIVSLRGENEDVDAIVEQHNKKHSDIKYGKTEYNLEDKQRFQSTAVDYADVFNTWKYNDKKSNSTVQTLNIGELINPVIKTKKRKLGQKQRLARRLGKEREEARKLKDLEIKKLIKKKFHKRGGKRNAKPKTVNKVVKFKTE